ncbi:hypothetical protein IP92_04903 [Pseudoduganella flava]|uniref:Uncharacterized protein n=1 Tax=Pseudoduganella flava TaxID=871742 RepID=A0A562PHI8_9BURK|nr:hypothetical protein [Pseudoduganella flava]QGZ42682.1 hypothetical protein GO485_29055 [Pseudoduganella flava]TWI43848.1 hypothetical protein IP92_04903 [Pseudoduganella flava]
MNKEPIEELKRLAEAATPGPWVATGPSFGNPKPAFLNEVVAGDNTDDEVCIAPEWDEDFWPERSANMEFIAAANPAAVLELIALAERAASVTPAPQAAAGELPTWYECDRALDQGTGTALHRFILNHEPTGDEDENWFRAELAAALQEARDETKLAITPAAAPVKDSATAGTIKTWRERARACSPLNHPDELDFRVKFHFAEKETADLRKALAAASQAQAEPVAWRYQRDTNKEPGVGDGEWQFMAHNRRALELQGKSPKFAPYKPNDSYHNWEPLFTSPAPSAASSDARDAARLDFMSQHEAWIAWCRDGEACRVFVFDEVGNTRPFLGWGAKGAWQLTAREAIDAAMSAAEQGGKHG